YQVQEYTLTMRFPTGWEKDFRTPLRNEMVRSMSSDSMIERISQILDVFQKTNAFKNVSDIARRAKLPVSTTHRLVKEMMTFGLLERDKQQQIRIGFKLWEISSLSSSSQTLREAARPFLDDLH